MEREEKMNKRIKKKIKKRHSINISEETHEKIKAYSLETNISQSDLVGKGIDSLIEKDKRNAEILRQHREARQ